jgi:hypothetical protein
MELSQYSACRVNIDCVNVMIVTARQHSRAAALVIFKLRSVAGMRLPWEKRGHCKLKGGKCVQEQNPDLEPLTLALQINFRSAKIYANAQNNFGGNEIPTSYISTTMQPGWKLGDDIQIQSHAPSMSFSFIPNGGITLRIPHHNKILHNCRPIG